jgi:hypothetical protein
MRTMQTTILTFLVISACKESPHDIVIRVEGSNDCSPEIWAAPSGRPRARALRERLVALGEDARS